MVHRTQGFAWVRAEVRLVVDRTQGLASGRALCQTPGSAHRGLQMVLEGVEEMRRMNGQRILKRTIL